MKYDINSLECEFSTNVDIKSMKPKNKHSPAILKAPVVSGVCFLQNSIDLLAIVQKVKLNANYTRICVK